MLAPTSDLDKSIRKFVLHNALLHNGKADAKSALGKLLGEEPELRPRVKELYKEINSIVTEINQKTESEIKAELGELAPELLHKEKQEKHVELPELPNLSAYKKVIMRFAPGPSGPLHIGHSRAIILNDEYVKRYSGKFILRLEDTNPQNVELEAYDMIPQDLAWLGVKYHELNKQSDRFDLYYEWAEKLLKQKNAYVCVCPVEDWRGLKEKNQPCPDRELPVPEQLERWQKMLARGYTPGAASMIVKTDLAHPNPAVRDFVAFRMVDKPHPITGDKYYVYPTYNFSVAIDDHFMGITHILRGKDHLNNTYRQKYIYDYLDWPKPEFLHYGWVSLPDVILKTTVIKEGIHSGKYTDWSDIQLGTLQALARRGILPETIRKFWLDIGIKDVDITFSWETLSAMNKELVDSDTNRYFFVWEPNTLVVTDVDELTGHAPLQPDDHSRGFREIKLKSEKGKNGREPGIRLLVTKEDLESESPGAKIRLKDLCNIELTTVDLEHETYAKYIGNDLKIIKEGAKIIHWVPETDNYPITIHLPDGKIKQGYCEKGTSDALNSFVQFERFGFVNLGSKTDPVIGWFAHK